MEPFCVILICLSFLNQVSSCFRCLAERCNSVLLWSSRKVLWTTTLPLTFHQHGGRREWLHFHFWVNCFFKMFPCFVCRETAGSLSQNESFAKLNRRKEKTCEVEIFLQINKSQRDEEPSVASGWWHSESNDSEVASFHQTETQIRIIFCSKRQSPNYQFSQSGGPWHHTGVYLWCQYRLWSPPTGSGRQTVQNN